MKPKSAFNATAFLRECEERNERERIAHFRDRDFATTARAAYLHALNPGGDYLDAVLQAARELGRNSLTR